ncbi:MAG: hypothetical protein WC455_12095 [Dehalococcoidia bacterium]|jgi:hypothetical protein
MNNIPHICLLARLDLHPVGRSAYHRHGIQIDGQTIWLTPKIYRYFLVLAAAGGAWVGNDQLEPGNPDKAVSALWRLRCQMAESLGMKWPPPRRGMIWPIWERSKGVGARLLPASVVVDPEIFKIISPETDPELCGLLRILTGE